MIQLRKLPTSVLDIKTGKILGGPLAAKPPVTAAPDLGIDPKELLNQANTLAKKGVPLNKVLEAIDKHPDIKDKFAAREFIKANFPKKSLENVIVGK